MIIQPAITSNYDEIVQVWESSVRATHDFITEQNIQAFKIAIKEQYLPNLAVFVIFDETNKIIGFIGTDENRLEMLFITPNNRGKGTGKLLLQYAINQLGITEVDVNEQNPQAVGFYQYMGFIQYARSEIDGEGNPFPILHMKLNTTK